MLTRRRASLSRSTSFWLPHLLCASDEKSFSLAMTTAVDSSPSIPHNGDINIFTSVRSTRTRRPALAVRTHHTPSISHELRTPLHGILAAAELLADTPLNHSQQSFLQTVQACGTSLVETVNHVLDFTKLSGNAKSGGVEHAIGPSRCAVQSICLA